jgi:acetyl-CoA carboxylase carboxyltransferase component
MGDKIEEFYTKKKKAETYEKEVIDLRYKAGKLTARDRIEKLLDKNSFVELDQFVQLRSPELQEKKKYGDGVVTGYGTIDKRPVFLYAQDFTVIGGSLGEMHAKKIIKVMRLARKQGAPFIAINDGAGARIQEGISGLDGYAEIFKENTLASGVIPQLCLILGPCAGGAAYSPALMDFVFMVNQKSHMFITGPNVIKATTGEDVDFEGLGGASVHNKKSGVAHFLSNNEEDCLQAVRKLLTYLPSNNLSDSPRTNTKEGAQASENFSGIVPKDTKMTYDIRKIIDEVCDRNSFFEVHEHFAKNVVVGFGRLDNNSIGIVANQPAVLAGCMDINASDKIARFVRFCDAFNIPIINFVDVPGYLPGTKQEHDGIIRHGAKVLFAYSEAVVPKIALIIRKAYGGAYIAMSSKDLGYDQVIAWPSAEIAVMGSEQAAKIIYRKKMQLAKDKKAFLEKKIKELDKMLNPYKAAELGKVDIVIDPKDTRQALIKTLRVLLSKRESRPAKKHGNVPL